MAYVVVGFAVYETLTVAVVLAFLATIAIPLTGVARSASRPADAVTYFGIDLRPAEVRPGELLMGFTLGPNETRAATLDVTDFCELRVVPRGGPNINVSVYPYHAGGTTVSIWSIPNRFGGESGHGVQDFELVGVAKVEIRVSYSSDTGSDTATLSYFLSPGCCCRKAELAKRG
ncbi:MAG TPA: hypothetical protein VKB73_03230 [Gaiellaceae bacterium]|nr:hypothetical protein [Gaiellaceae bacterium]